MVGRWHIELLGGFQLQSGDKILTRFRSYKTASLLAYLAFHCDRVHPREVIVDLFWPEAAPGDGNRSLRVSLSSLRRQLEPPGVESGAVLSADRFAVGINAAAITTDVLSFEKAIRAARRAGNCPERIVRLTDAVESYRGELLPGYYDDWIEPERQRLGEVFLEAAGELIGSLEAEGEMAQALAVARRAVRIDPLWEEGHRAVMRLQGASGHPDMALRHYEMLKRRLKQDLSAHPDEDSQALAREMKAQVGNRMNETADAPPAPPSDEVFANIRPGPTPRTVTLLVADTDRGTASQSLQVSGCRVEFSGYLDVLSQLCQDHHGDAATGPEERVSAVFGRASDALACALDCHRILNNHRPGPETPLPVRIALCAGEAETPEELGRSLLDRARRTLTAGHSGQILVSEEAAALMQETLPEGVRLAGLGTYRMGDSVVPRRLFQADYPGMSPNEFPPLKAESVFPNRLPLTLTRFFGREKEIARLVEMAGTDRIRLMTLTGPGGSGKTRLALEAAQRLFRIFEGAVWFIPLASISDAGQIGEAVLSGMEIPRLEGREPLEQAADALSVRPSLLVLDNYEHLAVEGAGTVRALLERAPDLVCLVTSRHLLELEGERDFPVMPLPTPQDETHPESLLDYASVRLFVDRAQMAKPDFQITPGNAAAVGALCARLEGIPLALELAASRVQTLTPGQMLHSLSHRFDLLVSRKRDGEARHRTLKTAIDWSYRLLSEEMKRLFAQLSVFRGGWALEAAEAVCEEPEARDALAQLAACSLIIGEETDGGMRYRMLETLREYAEGRLLPDEHEALADRHACYYREIAEKAEPELLGPQQQSWLNRLEMEKGNLRAALAWCRESGQAEEGLRLAGAMGWFWEFRRHGEEAKVWLGSLLSLPSSHMHPAIRGKALSWMGHWEPYALAQKRQEESLALARSVGDKSLMAWALLRLGSVAANRGEDAQAASYYAESRALFESTRQQAGMAILLMHTGRHAESLPLLEAMGENILRAEALIGIGWFAACQGDSARGRSLIEQGIAIQLAMGERLRLAHPFLLLGCIHTQQEECFAARERLEASLALYQETGDTEGTAWAINSLGGVFYLEGDWSQAQKWYEKSLMLFQHIGQSSGTALSFFNLGWVSLDMGKVNLAQHWLQKAIPIMPESWPQIFCGALECVAAVAIALGSPDQAACLFGATKALRATRFAPLYPFVQSAYERWIVSARSALTSEAFDNAWSVGQSLSSEEARAYALAVLHQQHPPLSASPALDTRRMA